MRRVILNFHGIGTPQRELEKDEYKYWVAPEIFEASLEHALRLKGRIDVAFTFDDGNISDLEIAAEPLAQAGYSAEIFVLSSRLDMAGSLGASEIKSLQNMGHRIGSHGADHVSWKTQDKIGLNKELFEAREILSSVVGHSIVSAAIPFGQYNRRVLQALRGFGYERVYSSDGGAYRQSQYLKPRTSPTYDMTTNDIEDVLTGHEPFKTKLRRAISTQVKPLI